MKINKHILLAFATMTLGLGMGLYANIFDDIRGGFESAGRGIQSAAETAGRGIRDTAETAGRGLQGAAETTASAVKRAGEEAARFTLEQAKNIAAFIAGSDFGKLVAMATDKVFSQVGFHLKDFVNSIIHAKDAGSSIGGSINALQQSIQAPNSPLKKVEELTTIAKSFEPKAKELIAVVDIDKIKGALSDPSQVPALMVTLGSDLGKKFDELKTIHDNLLGSVDSMQVAPILQNARNVLNDLVKLMNAFIDARNATGKLGELFLATDTRDALQHISNDLAGISAAIATIQKAGIQSASDLERSIFSGLFRHLDRILPVANQIMDHVNTIQTLVGTFGPNISKMQAEISVISKIADNIPGNINERIRREMSSAGSIAISILSLGTGAVVQAAVFAGYSLNDSINEIKDHLRLILQEASLMLGTISTIIMQATPILQVFKSDLDIDFVPAATVAAINEIGTHLLAMANHLQELKQALGGKAQVISPLTAPTSGTDQPTFGTEPATPLVTQTETQLEKRVPFFPPGGGYLAIRRDIVGYPPISTMGFIPGGARTDWVTCKEFNALTPEQRTALGATFCGNLGRAKATQGFTRWNTYAIGSAVCGPISAGEPAGTVVVYCYPGPVCRPCTRVFCSCGTNAGVNQTSGMNNYIYLEGDARSYDMGTVCKQFCTIPNAYRNQIPAGQPLQFPYSEHQLGTRVYENGWVTDVTRGHDCCK